VDEDEDPSDCGPAEVVAAEGKDLRVTSSDPGIVVLGGVASMKFDDEVEFYLATVDVEARTLGARATLRAELGSTSASCNAVVTPEEEAPNLHIRFADEEAGSSRAVVVTEDGQRVMKIMGRHPAMRRYLGPAPDFPNQEQPLTQAILAEILAGEATRMVMERKYPLRQADDLDAAAMYAEREVHEEVPDQVPSGVGSVFAGLSLASARTDAGRAPGKRVHPSLQRA
jgi:hypothetical protein